MAAHAPLSFLAEKPSKDLDRPLNPEEFLALWAGYKRDARRMLIARLGVHSLDEAKRRASADGRFAHLLATSGSVHGALVQDPEHIKDLMQEVAIALYRAICTGGLRAAVPVVKKWLKRTVRRLVPRASRLAAVHYFVRGTEAEHDFMDHHDASSEARSREPDVETLIERRELIDRARALIDQLEGRDKLVIQLWLEDVPHADIARELGITEEHARILLCRTLKRLRRAAEGAPPRAMARVDRRREVLDSQPIKQV